MDNASSTLINIPLHEQISAISELAERIQRSLQAQSPQIPEKVLSNLTQFSKHLSRISQEIAHLEDERNNLLALAEIGQLINSSLELNEVLRTTMDTIVRLSGAERGFLMLKDEHGKMEIRIARNWEQESVHPSEFAVSHTVIDRVVNEGQPVLTTNAQEDPRFGSQESIIAYSLRSILCVPLKVKGEITGVIYADNRIRTGLFTETEKEMLTAFANQAAIALENARLFESVRRTLAEVTELKNLMDNVFASIASGVITADIRHMITLCNRAAERILGCSANQLIGRSLDEILPPLAAELSEELDHVQNEDKHIVGQELKVNLPERGKVDLSLNLSPLKDAQENTQGVAIVLDDLTEKKRLEAQRRMFARMVSPAVIELLDPDQLRLGGRRAEITVLFADIRGFTSFSEELEPEELVKILNRYLSAAADAVLAQEGTIDKFNGDEIMAWFNAPIQQKDHTLRAVKAALRIREVIHALHSEFPREHRLAFGIGIHFGEAVLGLVGSENRLEYTAIGDCVNTGKRIQESTNANQILISAPAYHIVRDRVNVKEVPPIQAKGKKEPVLVYEVIGLKTPPFLDQSSL